MGPQCQMCKIWNVSISHPKNLSVVASHFFLNEIECQYGYGDIAKKIQALKCQQCNAIKLLRDWYIPYKSAVISCNCKKLGAVLT